MAYTNAIFYINLVSGSDAARAALTSCIASNPSGTTVRINKTGHGLVTGAIVDLSGFDAYLNDAWKISVVDADNFDLVNAVWSIATVDNNGTVTPRGGSSWTDGWLTISSGPTSARTQLGDTIRISKTDDPISLGSADWTNLSKTVTLNTPATQIIDLVESAFTVVTSTSITTTSRKQGTLAAGVNSITSPTANTRYVYRNLGTTLNLSSYDAITLWAAGSSTGGYTSTQWKICLCSDTAGVTVVDEFLLPAYAYSGITNPLGGGGWRPLVLTRVGGGALGSSIQSIAIYTGSSPTSTTGAGVYIDCVLACTSTGLNLGSLISKNSSAFGGTEAWYPIQSISGSTILLDGPPTTATTSGRGYYGVSETTTTYCRNTFAQTPVGNATSAINIINRSGTSTYPISYSGGWNTGSNVQDGETLLDGLNGYGRGIYLSFREFLTFERISTVRFYNGWYLASSSPNNQFNIPNIIGCADVGFTAPVSTNGKNIINIGNTISNNTGFLANSPSNVVTITKADSNIASGLAFSTNDYNNVVSASSLSNNGTNGINQSAGGENKVTCGTLADNGTAAVNITGTGDLYIFNANMSGTEFAGGTAGNNNRVFSTNHDMTGYAWIYTDGGTINSQATTFTSGSGAEWRLIINSATRDSYYPLKLPVAQYAVNSGSLIFISTSMKKSHATDIRGKLVIPGGQILGVPDDVVSTLADNTNEQTLTVTCTPTVSGVLGVEVWAEYVNNTGTVFVDQVTAIV
jgi:hypothetical protein